MHQTESLLLIRRTWGGVPWGSQCNTANDCSRGWAHLAEVPSTPEKIIHSVPVRINPQTPVADLPLHPTRQHTQKAW